MPSRRLLLSFAASLFLHSAILGAGAFLSSSQARKVRDASVTPAMLDAVLRPPTAAEPLLKDTLADTGTPQASEPASVTPANPATPPPPTNRKVAAKATRAAEQKLAEHVYYPPEAIAAGWEGEVRLLLTLSADGRVVDAQVASSSGHQTLDRAAVRAAFAMGALPGLDRTEIILPVVFRLQP